MEVPLVFGFQYVRIAGNIVVFHVAEGSLASRAGRNSRVALRHRAGEVIPNTNGQITQHTIVGKTFKEAKECEITVGGWRVNMGQTKDNGGEHGHCTVHEIIVFEEMLPMPVLSQVYNALKYRWIIGGR